MLLGLLARVMQGTSTAQPYSRARPRRCFITRTASLLLFVSSTAHAAMSACR
jgi:hypothetical protein